MAKFSQKNIECLMENKSTLEPFTPDERKKLFPEWDKDRCIRCGVCYVYCPDGAVYRMEDGFFDVDQSRCRGCGICHCECWFGVISMVEEE